MAPQRVAVTAELPGRTAAVRIAQVRPQITGIIQKRLFNEGANVAAGQALYQIDPATYRAAHDSAAAAVTKAEALLLTNKLRATRYTQLAATGVISQQDRDDVMANLAQAEADVATAKAALQTATINLAYTRITSPISGRIGVSDFTEGALVTANQAMALATVQQLDPMYVDLSQSADELLRLKQKFASGELQRGSTARAQVHITLGDGTAYARTGTLEFTDVSVSESTGAVTLRASVPNPDGQLLPGMFVRAMIEQGESDNAIIAPERSVQRDVDGNATVFVVANNGKVEQRVLRTGGTVAGGWLVTDGLAAGDRLVVEGIQKINAGDTVNAVVAGSAPVAAGAAGRSGRGQ
jgi:membrane fusion protein (multidrug efflux system)